MVILIRYMTPVSCSNMEATIVEFVGFQWSAILLFKNDHHNGRSSKVNIGFYNSVGYNASKKHKHDKANFFTFYHIRRCINMRICRSSYFQW